MMMIKRGRLYRMTEGLLLRLGGLVALLLALRPKWGMHPNDFYLGYPKHFYITQSDVAFPYVSVPWFLFDVAVCGLPVFAVVFLILYGVRRCPLFNFSHQGIDQVKSPPTPPAPMKRVLSLALLAAIAICGVSASILLCARGEHAEGEKEAMPQVELLLAHFASVPENPKQRWSYAPGVDIQPSDDPRELQMAVRNIGFDVLKDSTKLLMNGRLCVSRPDGSVVCTNQFIIRGSVRHLKRGELDVLPAGAMILPGAPPQDSIYQMDQPGCFVFWWQSGKLRSNTVAFEVDQAGKARRFIP